MTVAYRIALTAARVFVQGYGRLKVLGAKHIPRTGPVLIVANHDSPLDAFIIGVAAARQHRQIRFLTMRSLWRYRPLGFVLDRLHQIPIERGGQDSSGLDAAIVTLLAGHCVCVFPEGAISRGQRLRVHSGAARLLAAVPDAAVVGCAVTGAPALTKLRLRAKVSVVFFAFLGRPTADRDDWALDVIQQTMETVRNVAPPSS